MAAAESHADRYDMCTTACCDTCAAVALPAAECCTRQGFARCHANAATLCRKGLIEMYSCWRERHFLTSCVVQMEPEPMPTRRPSAPAAIRFRACRDVTTLPQMTSSPSKLALTHRSISTWYVESPAEHRVWEFGETAVGLDPLQQLHLACGVACRRQGVGALRGSDILPQQLTVAQQSPQLWAPARSKIRHAPCPELSSTA